MTQFGGLASILSGEPLPRIPPIADPELAKYAHDVNEFLRRLLGRFTQGNINSNPDSRIETVRGFIENPEVKEYTLDEYAEYAYSLTRITHKLVSGSGTFSVKVNGTSVGATGDNTFSSSQGVLTFTNNEIAIGDRVTLDVTIVSSPVDLAFTMKTLRAA